MHFYNKVWDEQVHGAVMVVDGNEVLVDDVVVGVAVEVHDVEVEVVGVHDDEGGSEVQVDEPQSEDEVHGVEVGVEEEVHDAVEDGRVEAAVEVHGEQEGGNMVLGVVEEVVHDVVEVVLRGRVVVVDDNVDAREVEGDDTQAWVEVVGVGFHN